MSIRRLRARLARRLGIGGEEVAARLLQRQGLTILERRYRRRSGEIDLVAEDGDLLVFVEVKTRRAQLDESPATAVDRVKRRRMQRTAEAFLHDRGWHERRSRFDVVEVVGSPGRGMSVHHIPDAFRPGSD